MLSQRAVPLPNSAEQWEQLSTALQYRWTLHRRPDQTPPLGDWLYWIMLAGRGSGKTRAGAEMVRSWVEDGTTRLIHFVAPTAADIRDVMVEGPAGILSVSPPWFMPKYEPSKRKLTWPNGAIARLYSADEPQRLRGPQCEKLWADELCAWRYQQDAWDMAMMGLRLGVDPRAIVTSTPRPQKLLKELIADPQTVLTKASTFDNQDNLAPAFLNRILKKYRGTRLGRQEIEAEILDDNPKALWKREWIEFARVSHVPTLVRIVVAVDPAVSAEEDSDDTGIVVVGEDRQDPPHYYVLEDATKSAATPKQWGTAAVIQYNKYKADKLIGEANNGGDMVISTIKAVDESVNASKVHASRGKVIRAEPISALYEQGRVHHVGTFSSLEDEMCEWEPGQRSPSRMDAAVWGITELEGSDDVAFSLTRIRR